jgi:hypothetical protein
MVCVVLWAASLPNYATRPVLFAIWAIIKYLTSNSLYLIGRLPITAFRNNSGKALRQWLL